MKLSDATDMFPALLVPTGMEDALVGVVERFGMEPVALIDKDVVIKNYMEGGMSEEEAEEFYQYNCLGAFVGDETPVFLITKIEQD